jgi:hypothetical protein
MFTVYVDDSLWWDIMDLAIIKIFPTPPADTIIGVSYNDYGLGTIYATLIVPYESA